MNIVVKTKNMYETGPLLGLSHDVCLIFPMKYHPKMIFHDIYIILLCKAPALMTDKYHDIYNICIAKIWESF